MDSLMWLAHFHGINYGGPIEYARDTIVFDTLASASAWLWCAYKTGARSGPTTRHANGEITHYAMPCVEKGDALLLARFPDDGDILAMADEYFGRFSDYVTHEIVIGPKGGIRTSRCG